MAINTRNWTLVRGNTHSTELPEQLSNSLFPIERVDLAVTRFTRIEEVLGANFGRLTSHPETFSDFPQSVQANAGIESACFQFPEVNSQSTIADQTWRPETCDSLDQAAHYHILCL